MAKKPAESHGDGPEDEDRQRRKEAQNGRVRLAERAARMNLRGGPIVRSTPRGEVRIHEVLVSSTPEGLECLEVFVAPGSSGETHYRIFNCPTGVRRPDGSIEEDPVAALAEVLALHGGATPRKRRRFR